MSARNPAERNTGTRSVRCMFTGDNAYIGMAVASLFGVTCGDRGREYRTCRKDATQGKCRSNRTTRLLPVIFGDYP